MTMDIANFYLITPLNCLEYVRIQISVILQEFIDEYDLMCFAHKGYVYFKISKGIYGLKQSGKLANNLLCERLQDHGYYKC